MRPVTQIEISVMTPDEMHKIPIAKNVPQRYHNGES